MGYVYWKRFDFLFGEDKEHSVFVKTIEKHRHADLTVHNHFMRQIMCHMLSLQDKQRNVVFCVEKGRLN